MPRWCVEAGSKPEAEGVTRALRFCVIESSIALRESLRNSGFGVGHVVSTLGFEGWAREG